MKGELFKEPSGGAAHWFLLALGSILTAVASAFFSASLLQGEPNTGWLGGAAGFLAMACVGASELVPRIRAAAVFHMATRRVRSEADRR